jgi:hypothetical protein
MNRMVAMAVVASLALAGCSSTRVESSVQAFSAGSMDPATETFVVVSAVRPENETLETRTWAAMAQAELTKRGYRVVQSGQPSTLIVAVGLAIDGGQRVTSSRSIPQFGVTGYSGSNTTGYISPGGYYSGSTTLTPTYGVTGSTTVIDTGTEYRRVGYMSVARFSSPDQTKPEIIYESRLQSSGSCGALAPNAQAFISALFDKFPTGGTSRVTAPANAC